MTPVERTLSDNGGPGEVPRPAVAPPEPWAFPVPRTSRLDNGLTVLGYDVPGQYVVSVRAVLPLPLAEEPAELEGIATLMSRLLDEGTAEHSAEEFAELLERKGISLGAGVTEAGLMVDLDVPKRYLAEALDLLTQALDRPDFPETEVRRHVRTRLAEIEQERASAPHRAARELVATYYAPEERASRPSGGRPETVAAVTRDALADFHARHVRPDGGTVVVAGDLTGVDTERLVDGTLGRWRAAPAPVGTRAVAAPVRAADAARIVLVDRPGSVQSELAVAWDGPDRAVPEGWAPYPVLSFVVGGSPSARVDAVLREEKGYTYGIRSTFRPRRRGGLFLTGGSVRADSTVESLRLLLDILDGGPGGVAGWARVTDGERHAGVDYVSKTAPGRFATADAIADEAAGLALDGLPLGFTTENLARTRALTADELSAAYTRYVDGRWSVVVVGDANLYADAVRALGRGEVTVVPN